jgi:hypothetical protein
LLEAAQSKSHNDHAILRSCVGLLLFGVPNRGLNHDNLLSLVKDKKNEPFVRNLIEGAAPLHNLHVAFARKYEEESCLEGCSIASFYETRDTPTVMVGRYHLRHTNSRYQNGPAVGSVLQKRNICEMG